MQHEWIIDVLTDLKTFAKANGMAALALQLEDSQQVAQVELASLKGMTSGLRVEEASVGRNSGRPGSRQTA